MSGKKFCRLCLNEVLVASAIMCCSDSQTKDILIDIFPEMDISLTKNIRLCEECFQNANFVSKVKEGFLRKEREFQKRKLKESMQFCRLCFKSETPSNILFNKNNYPSEILEEMWRAVFERNSSTADGNICGICMSWLKKIYRFKRQCIEMEESLQFYCSRKKLIVLGDRDLQDFLDEQYYLRTGVHFYDKARNSESAKIHNKTTETLDESRKMSANLSEIHYHEKYFQLTGEVFSNLDTNTLLFGSNRNFQQNEGKCSSQNPVEQNDVVLVLDEDHINLEDKIDVDESNNFEADDVFTEFGTINSSAVPVIVLGDDDDDNTDNNNGNCKSDSAKCTITEQNVRHYQCGDRSKLASSTSNASQHRNIANNNEENYCSPYSDMNNNSSFQERYTSEESDYQMLNLNHKGISCSISIENALSRVCEDTTFSNSSYEFYYNSWHNDYERNLGHGEVHMDDRGRFGANDVTVIDDDGFDAYDNRSATIDLTNDDTSLQTQDVGRKELYGKITLWGCYICAAVFRRKRNMKRHLLNHEKPLNKYGQFKCSLCPFRSNWKRSVTTHRKLHSKKFQNRFAGNKLRYCCPYCNTIYPDKGGIQFHMSNQGIATCR